MSVNDNAAWRFRAVSGAVSDHNIRMPAHPFPAGGKYGRADEFPI
ncbi:hypothetical protein [Paraburkholderia diazotrophica]|nr:hypothetical protein [Paraburkholderia diazotrophica]